MTAASSRAPAASEHRWLRVRNLFRPVTDLSHPDDRARERRRRIALSAVMSMVAKVMSVATQLITVPITLHYLGAERYGMWLIISSLATMLSFADLGIGNGILNTVAAAYGRDDRRSIRAAVSSGFVALGYVTALILLALLLAYARIDWSSLFNVHSTVARAEAGPVVAVFILCFALSVPVTIVQRVQLGMQRGFMTSLWLCLGSVLTLPAILTAIWCRAGLPVLVGVFVGAPLVANIANTIAFFGWSAPDLRPAIRLASRAQIGAAMVAGFNFMLIQIGNPVTAGCVPIIIAHVLGPQYVAQYAIPERLLALMVMLASMYVQPLWPAFREALVRGDGDWVAATYRRTLVVVLGSAAAALAVLGLSMPVLLRLWIGPSLQPSMVLVAGLCVYKLLECMLWVNSVLLNGSNTLAPQSIMSVANAVSFIAIGTLTCRWLGLAFVPWAGGAVLIACSLLPGFVLIRGVLAKSARTAPPTR